jgi:spermidine/putrescine transport system permease protein
MSAAVTLLCLLIGYPFAYFIAQKSLKMRIILLMLLMLPFMTNSLLRIYGWIIIIRTEGLLNQFLLQLQLLSDAQSFLYTNGAVLLGLTYTLLPFMVLPLYSSIEKLDISLREASNDLGAKAYKTFLHITLPLTMPGIFAGAIMVFIPSFGLFFIVDLLGGNKAMLIGNLIRNQFLTARNWPFGAALSMLLVLLTLVLVYLYKRTGGKMNALGGR